MLVKSQETDELQRPMTLRCCCHLMGLAETPQVFPLTGLARSLWTALRLSSAIVDAGLNHLLQRVRRHQVGLGRFLFLLYLTRKTNILTVYL